MIRLKSTCVAFKEWSLVCDALGAGHQSIILRKGGIAEGRGGFKWQANSFLLFPTHFHEQAERIRWTPPNEAVETLAVPGKITIRFLAHVEFTALITNWSAASSLSPLHIWKEEVVRERFGFGENECLRLAFARVFKLAEPWILHPQPSFGGCRSWLDLPERDLPIGSVVISDAEHAVRRDQVQAILAGA